MITREEAHKYMWDKNNECPSMRWGNHLTIRNYVDLMIDDIYDSLEQHIKSLEAQLSNTEQLTCKDCSKKLLCEMAQKSKDTFGTKLNEQWFNCFEKDTQ